MTESDVIALINDQLQTNGNNEITAAILRPVLIAIVQQINAVVGDPTELPTETTVIQAINNIEPQGLVVHSGVDNPNVSPPASFNVGDFYNQVIAGSTVAFWQFMGEQWINILNVVE